MTKEPTLITSLLPGQVAQITLNRPQALNALNTAMGEEMRETITRLEANPEVAAIVVTGSARAFAAGADIGEMAGLDPATMEEIGFLEPWESLASSTKPKIAAVRGLALGGGCELAMICDFIIAGESAKFGQPEVKLGVVAGLGGTQRMPRLIGRALAMDLHLTGRIMDAEEALRAGLVARVVPDDQVLPTAIEAARSIASWSRPAVRTARALISASEQTMLAEGLALEKHAFRALFGTGDQREGMQAFLEKRPATFGST